MLGRIHHVAYVVADIDAALERLGATFGLRPAIREVMADQGVEAALCGPAGGAVELIRPLDAEGAVARFLESRGEGLHHVAFEVDDLDAALADLRGARRRAHRRAPARRPRRPPGRVRPPALGERRAHRAGRGRGRAAAH